MRSLVLLIAAMVTGAAAAAEFPVLRADDHFSPRQSLRQLTRSMPGAGRALRHGPGADVKGRLATENDVAVLGVVDAEDNNRFVPLTETRCWNFQEATMAHWLATAPQTQFIFNDLVDGKFVSVIFDMANKTRRVVPYPVSAVSPDGKWAVSINYARLRLTRPTMATVATARTLGGRDLAADDGLWLVNLESGEAELIVSIASVRDRMPQVKDPKALAYFCHTVFSRDGSKIFWLARSVENLAGQQVVRRWETTAFTCNRDGSGVRRCFPDGWGGSHFNWLDGDRLMVTAKYRDAVYSHVLLTVGKSDYVRLGGGVLDFDGHGVFSDDGKWMATDTYPDKLGERKLMVLRMSDQAILPLGTYFVPEIYRETYSRCDLHPRWRPDGRVLGFNSVHEGSRQVYVIDITDPLD